MLRTKRSVVLGLPHHINQRGNGGANVVDHDQDRLLFLNLLARYSEKYGLAIWGYCLMSNHFHLLRCRNRKAVRPCVISRLEADFARFLNVRRGSSGHLWQSRYYSAAMSRILDEAEVSLVRKSWG